MVELLSQRSLWTPLGGVEGGLGLAVEGTPSYGAGQRDLEPLAGSTPSVTDVAAMPREGPALQADRSIGRVRAQSVCSGSLQGGQREVAWGGRCPAYRSVYNSELEVAGLVGLVCDVIGLENGSY